MLNALKHLPFAWRDRDEFCTPGPEYSKRKTVAFLAGGNIVSLDLPPHRPADRNICRGETPSRTIEQIERGAPAYLENNQGWQTTPVLIRRWAFWGPWLTGHKGDLHLSVSVVSRADERDYPNANFFHPKAFEYALSCYFTDFYGTRRTTNNQPHWSGPIKWKVQNSLPIFSATCELEKHAPPYGKGLNRHFLLFPITPKHFVTVVLIARINSRDGKGYPLFDTTPILNLRDAILRSVKVELGDKSKETIKALEADYGELTLTDAFEPMNWEAEKDPEPSEPPQPESGLMGIDFNYR
ncbi:hypothetical protein [Marinimicrobium agarilyticum]|uniref:hypothetical protein n=1 Tax=Marinimicrobium agarilyticum TaxID=306546 RepID=UPI00047FEBFC|nr:hypothetical protein [Marinimicrobium agarilyticum]